MAFELHCIVLVFLIYVLLSIWVIIFFWRALICCVIIDPLIDWNSFLLPVVELAWISLTSCSFCFWLKFDPFVKSQELLVISVASLALLASSGAQIAAPYFFGKVIQASMEKGMSKWYRHFSHRKVFDIWLNREVAIVIKGRSSVVYL